MRGSGNSSGLYFGEYLQVELDDCGEVVEWIRKQSWSNGKVAIYGKSWGG